MLEDLTGTYGMRFIIAIAGVGLALLVFVFILRFVRNRAPSPFLRGGRNRQPRLQVLDAAAVDTRRRLVLVRRDNVEHLIMIGGPTDIVIESGIRTTETLVASTPPRSAAVPIEDNSDDEMEEIEAPRTRIEPAPVAKPVRLPPTPVPAAVSVPVAVPTAASPVIAAATPIANAAPVSAPVQTPVAAPQPAQAPVSAPSVSVAAPTPRPVVDRPPENRPPGPAAEWRSRADAVVAAETARARPVTPAVTAVSAPVTPTVPPVIAASLPAQAQAADILDAARQRVMPQPDKRPVLPLATETAVAPTKNPAEISEFDRILDNEMAAAVAAEQPREPAREAQIPRPVTSVMPARRPLPDPTGSAPTAAGEPDQQTVQREMARIFGEMSANREK